MSLLKSLAGHLTHMGRPLSNQTLLHKQHKLLMLILLQASFSCKSTDFLKNLIPVATN